MRMSGVLWLGVAVVAMTAIATLRAVRARTGPRRLDVGSVSDHLGDTYRKQSA